MRSAALEIGDAEFLRLSAVERFSDGSGYCSQVSVQAGEFGCHGRRFYFNDLPQFVEQLRAGYTTLAGRAELRPHYEKEFLRFDFDSRGHVRVTGFLTEQPGSSLHFELETDQTFLPPFIADLEDIVRGFHA